MNAEKKKKKKTAYGNVADDALNVNDRDSLAHPLCGHLLRLVRPDLEVVGVEEDAGQTVAKVAVDPVLESPGLGGLECRVLLGLDHALEALEHLRAGEAVDVVLERIGDKPVHAPHPRLTMVFQPFGNCGLQQLQSDERGGK